MKVCYLYNEGITKYEFSKEHPMKPKRIKMAHSLINSYGLIDHMRVFCSKRATSQQLIEFHHPSYVKYLQTWVSPKPIIKSLLPSSQMEFNLMREYVKCKYKEDAKLSSIFNIDESEDCPGFQGLYDFCTYAAGGSLDAADLLITGQTSLAMNWAGGYHHAKKTSAHGFCFVNDIVLCILQLLKYYPRVLYLDIDVHHGDGVQEAFSASNRVQTVSFHQYSPGFFPETGALADVGEGAGKYFSVNVPLHPGIDDHSYLHLFKAVMAPILATFCPSVVIMQCGADSLAYDTLGHFNLSITAHAECLLHIKQCGLPMIVLGGGGYTIHNVSRCWTYETAAVLNLPLHPIIPTGDLFREQYRHDQYKLVFDVEQKVCNRNSKQYLWSIVEKVTENIRESQKRPCVPLHYVPITRYQRNVKDVQILIEEDQEQVRII